MDGLSSPGLGSTAANVLNHQELKRGRGLTGKARRKKKGFLKRCFSEKGFKLEGSKHIIHIIIPSTRKSVICDGSYDGVFHLLSDSHPLGINECPACPMSNL
jgi:hypothetical protein